MAGVVEVDAWMHHRAPPPRRWDATDPAALDAKWTKLSSGFYKEVHRAALGGDDVVVKRRKLYKADRKRAGGAALGVGHPDDVWHRAAVDEEGVHVLRRDEEELALRLLAAELEQRRDRLAAVRIVHVHVELVEHADGRLRELPPARVCYL